MGSLKISGCSLNCCSADAGWGERVKVLEERRGCPPRRPAPGTAPAPPPLASRPIGARSPDWRPRCPLTGPPSAGAEVGRTAQEGRGWTRVPADPASPAVFHLLVTCRTRRGITRTRPPGQRPMRFQLCEHFCWDGVLVHKNSLAPGQGRPAQAAFHPGVLLGPSRPPTSQCAFLTPIQDHRTQI